jgi:hypothetical protein
MNKDAVCTLFNAAFSIKTVRQLFRTSDEREVGE